MLARQDRGPARARRAPAARSDAHRAPLPLRADRRRALSGAPPSSCSTAWASARPPDTDAYGDAGSNTLGNVARAVGGLTLPHLEALGLGLLRAAAGRGGRRPTHGRRTASAEPTSAGKDSTTGHWELCGVVLERPFPTYPDGFPPRSTRRSSRAAPGAACSATRRASGTAVLDRVRRGAPADRQAGSSTPRPTASSRWRRTRTTVPLDGAVRRLRRRPRDAAGRARRVAGHRPAVRGRARGLGPRPPHRKDFSLPPPGPTLLDRLAERHVPRVGVGKVDDLFAGRGISSIHTATNAEAYGLDRGRAAVRCGGGLLLANVIEFDQTWGHRNDVPGFHRRAARSSIGRCPGCSARVREEDLIIFTADHGNDPTTPSTDHSREVVPVLVAGSAGPAGALWAGAHLRRHRPDGGRVPRCAAARGRHLVSARGLE